MKKIKKLDENFVIAHFIKGELDNDLLQKKTLRDILLENKISPSVVENPDISNDEENNQRKNILRFYRGYPDSYLFEGFPSDTEWGLYEINNDDFSQIMFISNDPFWNQITNGSRIIVDSKIDESLGKRHKKIIEISDAIDKGVELPEMIIVTDDVFSIILEGHHRGAAYGLILKKKDIKLKVIVGRSANLKGWFYY